MKEIDHTGQVFGRLTVLRAAESDARGYRKWVCRCECGTEKVVGGQAIRQGNTRSCGCLRREASAARMREITAMKGRVNAPL